MRKRKNKGEIKMENKTVCYCRKVDSNTIIKAIEDGAKTVEDIKAATGAATACGRCKGTIEQILKEEK